MRPGPNPTRRSRNIGTSKQGHGQDNRLVIPSPRADARPHWSRLGPHRVVTRSIQHRPMTFVVERTRDDSVHACTIDDLHRMLALVPVGDLEGIDLVVLRQPKRKEEILRPTWGRFVSGFSAGPLQGRAVLLDAVTPGKEVRWPLRLGPDDAEELARLAEDRHLIERTAQIVRVVQS